jgi:hypothetical protein
MVSRIDIAWQLASVDLQGLGADYLRNYVQSIYAVTPADAIERNPPKPK